MSLTKPGSLKETFENKRRDAIVLSYMSVRRWIGWLGIALPVAVAAGAAVLGCDQKMQPSISHYYFTIVGSLFVGILCAVGLFLINYKGYSPWEDRITNFAGLCAFGIALFPTTLPCDNPCSDITSPCNANQLLTGCRVNLFTYPCFTHWIHYGFAAGFFIAIIILSWEFFTRTDGYITKSKRRRNRVYRACALLMSIFCILIPICDSIPSIHLPNSTFYLELLALWSFGVSWLIKGAVLLKDSEPEKRAKAEAKTAKGNRDEVRYEPQRAQRVNLIAQ